MARFFSSSRMSVGSGKRYRRRINAIKVPRRSSSVVGGASSSSGVDKSKEQSDGCESGDGNPSGNRYQVFDVCDRSPDSNDYYKVRWKGYPQRKYDTYEPASHLKSIGLEGKLKEIDEYVIWRESYMKENVNVKRAPSIYKYRKLQGTPTYAANEDFTCVLVALNTMNALLRITFSFDYELIYKFGGKRGFKYSKLRKLVEYQQKTLKEDYLSIDGIKNNRIKGCFNNTKLILANIRGSPGVYLCGAGNTLGLHHVFVLVTRRTGIYIFDDALNMEDELLVIDDLSWIANWKFVLKGTRGS